MPDTARPTGLTSTEAARRLRQVGPNALPEPTGTPVWRQLFAQLTHFFAAMLWVAGVLAIIGGLPELGVAIFIVIVVNALFAFAQEYRAEQAAARLKSLLPLPGHGRPRRFAAPDRRRRHRSRRSRRAHRWRPGGRGHDLRGEPRTSRRHLDADRRERARLDRRRRRLSVRGRSWSRARAWRSSRRRERRPSSPVSPSSLRTPCVPTRR